MHEPSDAGGRPVVQTEDIGAVRVITLAAPDRGNALTRRDHHELATLFQELPDAGDIGAAVLTGAGEVFNSGADVGEFLEAVEDPMIRKSMVNDGRRLLHSMVNCPVPIVAAVNGPAIGLGCSLALLCDLVLMAPEAYLQDNHVSLGLVAGDGGALVWPLLTTFSRAKEYLWTGTALGAEDALASQMISRVVARDKLLSEAKALAGRLAALPRQAVRDTKYAMHGHMRALWEVAEYGILAEEMSFMTDDVRNTAARFRSSPEER